MIQLSKRLQAVADLVTEEGVLADIGTDHGYIPIYLVQKGRISGAIAADIKEGPLLRAKEHIEKYDLGAYIETRLSDGAKKIAPQEAQILVLAGMGGGLMQRIIRQSREVFFAAKEVILQPQSEQEALRRYLIGEGFGILAEDMVKEDGKYYPMMRVFVKKKEREEGSDRKDPYENARDISFLYGAYLLESRHPVLRDFLEREEKIYTDLLKELHSHSQNPGIEKRIFEIEKKRSLTQKALSEYFCNEI